MPKTERNPADEPEVDASALRAFAAEVAAYRGPAPEWVAEAGLNVAFAAAAAAPPAPDGEALLTTLRARLGLTGAQTRWLFRLAWPEAWYRRARLPDHGRGGPRAPAASEAAAVFEEMALDGTVWTPAAEQPLDAGRLLSVADRIRAEPERYDQTKWCGLAFCVAGHAFWDETRQWPLINSDEKLIRRTATARLNLNEAGAAALFHDVWPVRWLQRLTGERGGIGSRSWLPTPGEAVAVLRGMAASGYVWH